MTLVIGIAVGLALLGIGCLLIASYCREEDPITASAEHHGDVTGRRTRTVQAMSRYARKVDAK